MLAGSTIHLAVALAVLLTTAVGSQAQELNEVALAYLQRHGVPCLCVIGVDRPVRDFDLIATCDDGRQWGLFFIEGEVAYLQPATGEPYRWRPEVHQSHPEVYVDRQLQAGILLRALQSLLERSRAKPQRNYHEQLKRP